MHFLKSMLFSYWPLEGKKPEEGESRIKTSATDWSGCDDVGRVSNAFVVLYPFVVQHLQFIVKIFMVIILSKLQLSLMNSKLKDT